ncbi:SH2 domain-containing protein 6 isoform X1 [Coregonus clupeaformis]|uniref:SH2 domain-containing protein 6 isoform X1 n=1 Tax=Coregonus clupeaformis TaxID=59861 RepID=UPI001BE12772|nr:SH2 domain-containing protein 6 isoform X1 [Coregonus clupeaformis]
MTMSFFGKFKPSGPPAPPQRIENNAGYGGWPEDEFDEEDGDTYEAPPCERPALKVPSRHVEENVYLERTSERSNPVLPKRQAAPPPRPAKMAPMGKALKQQPHQQTHPKEFYIDPNTKKREFTLSPSLAPEVDRKEKPGKRSTPKKSAPPPSPTPASPSPPAEEDVYLDPNEGQGDSDDLYLEPTAAFPPAPRGPMRMPLPPKTAAAPPPMPIKPPVPRAGSSSLLVSEAKTAPPPDIRRSMFPGKLPPPTLGIKPPLPASLKVPKPSPPPPPTIDTTAAVSPSGMKTTIQAGKEEKEWFAGNCDRKTAEDLLLRINKDGAFLIRHSSAQNARQPYTLAVLYRQKVYNIPIRFLEETHGYALGKEGKKNEEFFCSLQEIISHHKNNQLLLIDSKSQAKHTTYLTHPACP